MIKVTYTCEFEFEDNLTDEDAIYSVIEIMRQSGFESIGEFKILKENSDKQ